MATLTMIIGALTSSFTADNTKAANVLQNVFALYHADDRTVYTNQQKLDWIVQMLLPRQLTQMSRQYTERMAVQTAMEDFESNGGNLNERG